MDITLIGLLTFLLLAALWSPAEMSTETWISNGSGQMFIATLYYHGFLGVGGETDIVNRAIVPGDHQGGLEWSGSDFMLEVWMEGSCCHAQIFIDNDESVLGLDNGEGGVTIWKAQYGTLFHRGDGPLTNIFYHYDYQPQGDPGYNSSCNIQC